MVRLGAAGFIQVVALLAPALGKPVMRSMLVHEARQAAPSGFTRVGPAPGNATLDMRIALVQSNTGGLIDALHDVSDPASASYGQHLTKAEVDAFAAPDAASVDALNSWLSGYGINATAISSAGDWVAFKVNVSTANALFDADYSVFSYGSSGQQTIRTLEYSVPSDLKSHIDLAHPTITFPNPIARPVPNTAHFTAVTARQSTNATSPCGSDPLNPVVDPLCLQSVYEIPSTPATSSANRLAVAGYDSEYANAADLEVFLKQYRPDMNSSTTFTLETLDDGSNPQSAPAGVEAAIDIQYTVGVATNVPTTFISVGSDYHDDGLYGFLDTANYLLQQDAPPQVLTTSYSSNEELISPNLANNLCNAYAQLGARGLSILFSSGDGGTSGSEYGTCTTFVPTFPNGCPYVTSVGGTAQIPEVAMPESGGGFSNYFQRPAWQDAAVSAYLTTLGDANAGLYNASGRGYPDVAALSAGFPIVWNGTDYPQQQSGTSCAAPTFASVVALLNDRLLAAGRPPLGWLNPWMYTAGAGAFTDVTTGNNNACCENEDCSIEAGFNATVGWDPVTGFGSPNFTRMAAVLGL